MQLNSATMNLARQQQISYSKAAKLVQTAEAGTPGRLSRSIGTIIPITKYTSGWTSAMEKANPVGYQHAQMLDKQATASLIVGKVQKVAGGEMEKFSHTTAGSISNLEHAAENLGEKFGKELLPVIRRVTTFLGKFATEVGKNTGAGRVFNKILGDIGAIVKKVGTYIGDAVKDVAGLVKGFQQGKVWAIAIVAAMAGFAAAYVTIKAITIATQLWKDAQIALNIVMDTNIIAVIVIAVIALIAALVVVYLKVKKFRDIVKAVFDWMKGAVTSVIGFVRDHWKLILGILTAPFGGPLILFIVDHFHALVGIVKSIPGKIAAAAVGMWDGIKSGLESVVNWILDRLNTIIGYVNKVIGVTILGHRIGATIPLIPHVGGGGDSAPATSSKPPKAAPTPANAYTNMYKPSAQKPAGHRAQGGPITQTGVYDVGELGRERVYLPQGAYVQPHHQLGGGVIENHVTLQVDGVTLAKIVSREVIKQKAVS